MNKQDKQRTAYLDLLADHVLAHGLGAASLRPLAEAAKTSDRMLLYYFKDKASLIAAVLDQIAARLGQILTQQVEAKPMPLAQLRPKLLAILFADAHWPYMRIWLDVAALAGRGDPFYKEIGGRIARQFFAWGEAQLESATPAQRNIDAAQLLVSIEGALFLRSVGLEDISAQAF
jgi:AcrR family transcriptional regulator